MNYRGNTIGEIGSEFYVESSQKGRNEYISLVNYPKRYVLSGRTGLYLIASELKTKNISSVAMPAYCCGSMVAPFVDAGFEVSFYEDDSVQKAEAILIMDYFGFVRKETVAFAHKCYEAGKKIIVDATQTAFSRSNSYLYADYIVVSYRKWLDCLCAAVYSKNGFITDEYKKTNKEYVETWKLAAKKKKTFLEAGVGEKQDFLDLYAKANHMLAEKYIGYAASNSEIELFENLDSTFIRNSRRENAKVLIDSLSQIIEMMFTQLSDADCPLHVPIILNPEERARIRKILIQKSIYCPCHWPIDEQFPYQRTLNHDRELSLICDQRYMKKDMIREVESVIYAINKEDIGK